MNNLAKYQRSPTVQSQSAMTESSSSPSPPLHFVILWNIYQTINWTQAEVTENSETVLGKGHTFREIVFKYH